MDSRDTGKDVSSLQLPYEGDQSIWKQFIRLIELVNFAFQATVWIPINQLLGLKQSEDFKFIKSSFVTSGTSVVSILDFKQAEWLWKFGAIVTMILINFVNLMKTFSWCLIRGTGYFAIELMSSLACNQLHAEWLKLLTGINKQSSNGVSLHYKCLH